MIYECIVTFEFDEDPPITWRGNVNAPTDRSAAYAAITKSREDHKRIRPASVVVVIKRRK